MEETIAARARELAFSICQDRDTIKKLEAAKKMHEEELAFLLLSNGEPKWADEQFSVIAASSKSRSTIHAHMLVAKGVGTDVIAACTTTSRWTETGVRRKKDKAEPGEGAGGEE